MPDTELTQMAKLDEKAIIAGIVVEILTEKDKEFFDKLFEADRLMCKNIFLNEKDLTKKIGVIRGDHFSVGMWNNFAAIYTVGSNDSSCGITFETRDKNSDYTVERMRIDAAGNIGIGTISPQSQLHLNVPGSKNPISAMTIDVQTFGNVANAQASYFLKIRDIGAQPPNGKTHFIVNGLGNVGIGTAAPEAGLHIDKANTNDVALKLSSNGPGWGSGIQLKNNNIAYGIYSGFEQFHIYDVNKQTDRLIIDATGNIGIGTTTPSTNFDVVNGGRLGNVAIGAAPFGNLNYAYESIQLPADHNLRINFGSKGTAIFENNGTLDINGNIKVTGDVILTGSADCAEDFDIIDAESIEPGTVMVIDDEGALRASEQAYDRRVAGVISGAGDLRPGIMLDRQSERANRLPLALTGKVYCKVDAKYSSIEVGDLLTTSLTPGHAMKADDPAKAFGAVIGKALNPIKTGRGLIPILIALQ